MRAAVQLAERVQFLRGSVRGSFSAPVFTPFPLRTNVRATESTSATLAGGVAGGTIHKVKFSSVPSTTLYYKACKKSFPVLLCTTKLAQSRSQYYFVLQSLHKARSSTTLY